MSGNKSKSLSGATTNSSNPTNTSTNTTNYATHSMNPSAAASLDFVKNLWGGMQIPDFTHAAGMNIPTVSMQDLDKKIEDLKTVESWLQVNMSMLHSTIQTLEAQRVTLATLQSMSATLAGVAQQSEIEKGQSDRHAQLDQPTAWWNVLQDQFRAVLSSVVPDTSENGVTKVATPKPQSGKKSVKRPATTVTKTAAKLPAPRAASKKAVE